MDLSSKYGILEFRVVNSSEQGQFVNIGANRHLDDPHVLVTRLNPENGFDIPCFLFDLEEFRYNKIRVMSNGIVNGSSFTYTLVTRDKNKRIESHGAILPSAMQTRNDIIEQVYPYAPFNEDCNFRFYIRPYTILVFSLIDTKHPKNKKK